MPQSSSPYRPALGVEETGIRRAAVIGAGAMGAGIAAQFANAGLAVDLLDVPGKAGGRNAPAEAGIARQLKSHGFMAEEGAALLRAGNIEDDLHRLAEADWIVEAVVENLEIKRSLYAKIDAVRRPGTIVSSNTSTIPRRELVAAGGDRFAADFVITHFFNPPRVMRLVEIVAGPENSDDLVRRVANATRSLLGKSAVMCRDTPGFIANRIGCYWLAAGVLEAARLGLTVEEADAVNAALGVPRTGVFGLMDLIGIDLVPAIWGSLMQAVPAGDRFRRFDLPGSPLIGSLIAEGRHGRKTGQGFYRKGKEGRREALDLVSGAYRPAAAVASKDLPGGGRDVAALLADEGRLGVYAASLFSEVLAYAAACGPEIAEDVGSIDAAIELGYSWREGPFRMADRIGLQVPAVERLSSEAGPSPLLAAAAQKGFYSQDGALLTGGDGRTASASPSLLAGDAQIIGNAGARLRDLGDGIACFEITSKMNSFAPEVFDILEDTLARAGRDFQGLVLGNDDRRAFSAGADLSSILKLLDGGDELSLEDYLARGQRLFLGMKYLPVPVVAAVHGFTLGGGCEFMLHADASVAHAELNAGLPETKVGLIPGWGGGTQLLLRGLEGADGERPPAVLAAVFDLIRSGAVASSARQAMRLGLLRKGDGITMHREDLLPAAKAKALSLVSGYAPPPKAALPAFEPSACGGLLVPVAEGVAAGRLTETDETIAAVLAFVLTGGKAAESGESLTEEGMMALERQAFLKLVSLPASRARMEHMLKTGKPLRN
ncbi:3-hydroxyacyl-CoA dehydrogenase/enoyl-CoA hydratase family protein [Pelagibius sp. CAU 1746]|uniref:3-hydroxyacyl-CoA dehydrogenase/enoyl-CoA hydratase family protein n=1 Tax=Pelagibius sp. CAU 1746 TaxID=3140370 RepID=UPI00325A5A6F